MAELHQLTKGNDGDWYVVPIIYLDTFYEMMNCDWDEITKEGYEMLDKWRVGGPHEVSFMWETK